MPLGIDSNNRVEPDTFLHAGQKAGSESKENNARFSNCVLGFCSIELEIDN